MPQVRAVKQVRYAWTWFWERVLVFVEWRSRKAPTFWVPRGRWQHNEALLAIISRYRVGWKAVFTTRRYACVIIKSEKCSGT